MAILTDDCDIRTAYLRTFMGGNGDYYIEIIEEVEGVKKLSCVRVSTSGGNAPTDVKIAVAELYRAMEKAGLNEFPD